MDGLAYLHLAETWETAADKLNSHLAPLPISLRAGSQSNPYSPQEN